MPEGVEKVDTLRQNQDFDEVTVCINSTFHRHKNALKLAVFIVGNEFGLQLPFGKHNTAKTGGQPFMAGRCFPSPSAILKKYKIDSYTAVK